ncbi:hypothetical protein RND81_01G108600 [Saponaria officinalis]|uniref:SBP-type domain-containing protein n=1 Tax=Saponaria officinalis TaxID=3572 RepID=A0AAW1NI11_SAPOF
MEEVAAPLFIHPSRFCEVGLVGKKRTLCYNNNNNNINNQRQQHSQVELNRDGGWNPNDWEWDSGRFVARARQPDPNLLCLSTPNSEGGVSNLVLRDSHNQGDQNGNGLRLQVGGAHVSPSKTNGGSVQSSDSAEEVGPTSRPNKKVRSGSPGSGGNYPVCQVDDCTEDLSKAKDYHRRHKVCVLHSKATQVFVGSQMQRFCQQCSRFHPLSEFDEGKRSCRRRLAGHNRRRRKTQPEDATSPVVHPTNNNDTANGNLDIVNLLTVLARGQDKNQLIEILSKISALPRPSDLSTGSTKNISEQAALVRNKTDSNPAAKPNMDIYERSSSSYPSPTEDSDGQVQDPRMTLPLQLFSPSPGFDSPPNIVSPQKYFSSDSCSPPDERSHPSSVPITRTLFPLETTSDIGKTDRMSISDVGNVNVEASQMGNFASGTTLELFSLGNRAVSNMFQRLPPHQAGYTSSGSDHSPPSFNSSPQKDRTGRIMFKLFDKDPGQFPGGLRTQIYNWLSDSPSEMESFIRPGCVVLSVYVSMQSPAWEKLEDDFAQQVSNLIRGSNTEFWRSGRFSVNIGRQLAFHKGGKFNFCKPWSMPDAPELIVVSPLAVVSGHATSLVIRGRNLTSPGTKIHCAYKGGYSSKDVSGSTYQGFTFDEIRLSDFKVHTASSFLGRCFIEVENGVRGNSFPIIIADAKICQELRLLEHEFDDPTENVPSPGSQEEIVRFLNELGWLFQRKSSSAVANHDFLPHRFQYLLTFSIERDYCALVKTLLDIYVETDSTADGLSTECIEAVAKMHLLHRAVKKKSKRMVDLLIQYSVPDDDGVSKRYVFPPNLKGPGGITPLHLAASTSGSYDIVDILTNDPMQIGLQSWKSLLDDNGHSPSAYATMRNDHSLNSLVAQKLVDRRNSQVSISFRNEMVESLELTEVRQRSTKKLDSCSRCALMAYTRMPGSHGMLHRPFIHSMLGIAAVCVCVCLFFKSMSAPYNWENFDCGSM